MKMKRKDNNIKRNESISGHESIYFPYFEEKENGKNVRVLKDGSNFTQVKSLCFFFFFVHSDIFQNHQEPEKRN